MAMNCDPCDCPEQYYREKQTWRKAVLTLLCRMISLISTLVTNIAALAQAAGQGGPGIIPTFEWKTTEQIWPFESTIGNTPLFAKAVAVGTRTAGNTDTIAHGITNLDVAKIHRLELEYVNGTAAAQADYGGAGINLFIDATNITINGSEGNGTGYVYVIYGKV